MSKIGPAVRAAMDAREALKYAISETIDSSSAMGYELGWEDHKYASIDSLESEIDCLSSSVNLEFLGGMRRAIEILKGVKNGTAE